MKKKHYADRLLPPVVSRAGVTALLVFIAVLVLCLIDLALSTLEQFGLAQGEGFGAQPLYGDLMAAALVSAVPVVALYLAFQRYLVHGLAAGAVSGLKAGKESQICDRLYCQL